MAQVINPKATVIDFGPKLILKDNTIITPDDFVYGAANITYKDIGVFNELIELKKTDPKIEEKIKKTLIKVGGAGHASMATTPGFWVFLEGNCSKIVDSVFTTAKFGSALMPSSRRIPIEKESIVTPLQIVDDYDGFINNNIEKNTLPKDISKKENEILEKYLKTSEKNIQAYKELQERGVPKQEASKIVQYGHKGGGFMFMPLETMVYFSKLAERNPLEMPTEAREIISQLEDFIHENGMKKTYESRKAAPRTGCPNPNIFTFRKNEAQELKENFSKNKYPELIHEKSIPSTERDKKIREYLNKIEKMFNSPEEIQKNYKNLLGNLEEIINDFNNSISITTLSNISWRVWGEDKRHRTINQSVESIYNAVDNAIKTFKELPPIENFNDKSMKNLEYTIALPSSVKKNKENLEIWYNRFDDSLKTYEDLIKKGVRKSNAIQIIPRGIKVANLKNLDLYNLTTGHTSLRLCRGNVEPEKYLNTKKERKLILDKSGLPQEVKELINSQCCYTGFCHSLSYKKSCGNIRKKVKFHNQNFYDKIHEQNKEEIMNKLK